ncbi:MAG: electron transfer flavoprotein subunit beta/FixA family protein [Syntrophobacteraceae bacterium]|nr:electron transfer flavoprotein subunit beta/FixA family protein [Syntrophobacteraceae bacterium]
MKEPQIIVCAKQIPDPEAPFSNVTINVEKKQVVVDAPDVISPYDENGLEAALKIKEELGGKITVLSMGRKVSDTLMRKAIAAGADGLILLEDPLFEGLCSNSVAYVLSCAIKKIGDYDLILTGRQAGDWDSGQVGLILGEILDLPCISLARSVKLNDEGVLVEKSVPVGYEVVQAALPAVVTVSNEVGELRYVARSKMLGLLKRPMPIPKWSARDLGCDEGKLKKLQLVDLALPADMGRDCCLIEGAIDDQAGRLASILGELR